MAVDEVEDGEELWLEISTMVSEALIDAAGVPVLDEEEDGLDEELDGSAMTTLDITVDFFPEEEEEEDVEDDSVLVEDED